MKALERMLGRVLINFRAGEAKTFYRQFGLTPSIQLESAFANGGKMVPPFLGLGDIKNISPPLTWSGISQGTVDLLLLIEDVDVPFPKPLVHGLAYWPASSLVALPEAALSKQASVKLVNGRNSLGGMTYAGPTPIRGHGVHRYVFQLFAVDQRLDLAPGFKRKDLTAKLAGHILGIGVLTGIYERK